MEIEFFKKKLDFATVLSGRYLRIRVVVGKGETLRNCHQK